VPIAHAELDVVVRIESEVPVGPQVRSPEACDREESFTGLSIEREPCEPARGGQHGWHEGQPPAAIVVFVPNARLLEAVVLAVSADPRRARRERTAPADIGAGSVRAVVLASS